MKKEKLKIENAQLLIIMFYYILIRVLPFLEIIKNYITYYILYTAIVILQLAVKQPSLQNDYLITNNMSQCESKNTQ